MALDFKLKDVMHRIVAKFFPAYLPEAKKPYNLRAVYQPELDIHGIASKAEVYNVTTSPKVIEEGAIALMELIYYLAADGYKINTPVFRLHVGIPGEYDGHETHLPEGTHPRGLLAINAQLREYLAEKINLQFDGIENNEGFIATLTDTRTGETNLVLTGPFILHGTGLKITSDADHANDVGLFYENAATGVRSKEYDYNILQNEPKVLSVSAWNVAPDASYYIVIRTQSSVKGNAILKDVREVKSDFTVAVERGRQAPEATVQQSDDVNKASDAPQPDGTTPPSP